ncbi:hypothetical protein KY285_036043 [Solanum tuberosum]|nr:hypothetical protein KY285_036043 [Solanum tuberosum]
MDNFSSKVRIEKVFLLKSSTHQNVVAAIPLHRDENLSSWSVPPLRFGELYPRLRSLTYIDNQGKYFLPRSCSYLFSTFYRLTKAPSTEFRFENGQSSGLGDRENMLSLHQGCLKVVQNQG